MQSLLQYRRLRKVADEEHSKPQHRFPSHDQQDEGQSSDNGSPTGEKEKYIIVEFDDSDPEDPHNWSYSYKWCVTGLVGSAGFIVAGASAIDAEVSPQIMKDFGVGEEVALLGTTLFMVAFGLGSMISAPFSEVFGRNPVYLVSLAIFALFTMGAGLAPHLASWLTCRFFAGLFACPPLTNFGGTTADIWNPAQRTYVFPVLACLSFLGPFLAPMVADFIGPSPLVGWKWTEWLTLILTGALVTLIFLLVPETYSSVLLRWKASHLRKQTNNPNFVARGEIDQPSFPHRLKRSVALPLKFLFTEPILDLFALYLVIVYIILFGFLPGFDFVFGSDGIYGFDQEHTGLCFIGMNVGFLLALGTIWPIYRRFLRKLREAQDEGKSRVVPEERLVFAMIGAPLMPASLFWMGWTTWPSVSFWSSLVASAVFGFSVMMIFVSCYQYIIDCYEGLAASALVGMTLTRYLTSGPMVIVSVPMYENLGVHWTLTLLAFLALLMTPVPYAFFYHGHRARKRSKNATDFD